MDYLWGRLPRLLVAKDLEVRSSVRNDARAFVRDTTALFDTHRTRRIRAIPLVRERSIDLPSTAAPDGDQFLFAEAVRFGQHTENVSG